MYNTGTYTVECHCGEAVELDIHIVQEMHEVKCPGCQDILCLDIAHDEMERDICELMA